MVSILCILCAILFFTALLLAGKVISLRRAAKELQREFAARLREDTNVGIDISTSDTKMRALAADMNRQLKLLRKEHIRYTQGDRELKTAITGISHDLRTPLTAICGYLELLEREEMSEQVRSYVSVIANRVLALKELTEELFRYSVILSVDSCGEREEVSLDAAVEECIAAYYGALMEAGIEPEITLSGASVVRRLNRQALSRILSNIMSNVIKYSSGDCEVIVREDGGIHFWNRTEGLDEVQVGHLFDRFYTVRTGRDATGLGLSIAKALTEESGGRIFAEYEAGKLHICLFFPPNQEGRDTGCAPVEIGAKQGNGTGFL